MSFEQKLRFLKQVWDSTDELADKLGEERATRVKTNLGNAFIAEACLGVMFGGMLPEAAHKVIDDMREYLISTRVRIDEILREPESWNPRDFPLPGDEIQNYPPSDFRMEQKPITA